MDDKPNNMWVQFETSPTFSGLKFENVEKVTNGKENIAVANKFCQINTGEGKITITALLAVLNVLKGSTVDIIASNEVLARTERRTKGTFMVYLVSVSVILQQTREMYQVQRTAIKII